MERCAMQGLREEGGDGDSYVPGKVSFPAGAGRIVQVSAGAFPASRCPPR